MKKLLVGLLLVASSALSFGAQRVPYEKLSFPGGYISYNDEKFTGEFERKDPRTGKINMVGSVKNGELHRTSYSYDENGKFLDEEIRGAEPISNGDTKFWEDILNPVLEVLAN